MLGIGELYLFAVLRESYNTGFEAVPWQWVCLAPQCLINLVGIESHNYRTVNDHHGSGHKPKSLQIGQGARVLRYVLLLKLYALLRKIFFRLVAEHSPVLGINDDVLHLLSPPVGFVPLASPLMASFASLVT